LFTNGMGVFDKAVEEGIIDRILTTNVIYQSPEVLSRSYYPSVDLSKYIALLIDTMNHDVSIESLLSPVEKIHTRVENYKEKQRQQQLKQQQK